MEQPLYQNPADPSGQLAQSSPYQQSGQTSDPSPAQRAAMQQQVAGMPSMPGGPQPQLQGYPQQQMYQPPVQPRAGYNPGMSGGPQPQLQGYPQQQMYQPPVQPQAGYNMGMPGGPQQQLQGYPQQQMYQPPMQPPAQITAVNVNINTQQKNNGCVRAIYFVFIGWWLGFWCLEIGFLLCAFIVTLPVGLMILNRLPQIMTLKPTTQTVQTNVNVTSVSGAGSMVNVNVNVTGVQQRPFIVRAIYYIFVGCWVGYIWASLAYLCCLSLLGLPLGILMLNQLPAVLTLRRN